MEIEDYIADLNSSDKELLFVVTERIINRFETYAEIDAHEFMMLMNSIILKCTSREIQEDRETFEHLLEALEMGVGRNGTNLVNFEPLIEVFSNGQFSDIFDQLVIILGSSRQPKYIDYLSAIETNNSSLKKEIDDAIFELKYSKY